MFKLAVLVSGSGSNLQAIIDAIADGKLDGVKIALVISSKANVFALERAKQHDIKSIVVQSKDNDELCMQLGHENIDAIVLAGYLPILHNNVVKKYENRIINIHPSLIPKYCGRGYYGIHVHEAVLENNEIETGATVHFVDSGIDTGNIIVQKKVNVYKTDTPEILQARVLEVEHKIIVDGILALQKSLNK